jgi:hypothetical protein
MSGAVTGVIVKYGDYRLKPAPLVNYEREVFSLKNDGTIIGGNYKVSLNGTILPDNVASGEGGALDIFSAQNDIHSAFSENYKMFTAHFSGEECGGYVIAGRPAVESITIDSVNQHAQTANYNIDLVFAISSLSGMEDALGTQYGLEDAQTSYSVGILSAPRQYYGFEFPGALEVERQVQAVGQAVGSGNINETGGIGAFNDNLASGNIGYVSGEAIFNALRYVVNATSGLPDINTSGLLGNNVSYRHFLTDRKINKDPLAGSVSVTDNFVSFPTSGGFGTGDAEFSGTGVGMVPMSIYQQFPAVDNFSVNVEKSADNGLVRIGLEGQVQGYPNLRISIGTGAEDVNSGGIPRASGTGSFDTARLYVSYCLGNVGPVVGTGEDVFYNRANLAYKGRISQTFTGVQTYDSGTEANPTPSVLKTGLLLNKTPLSEAYSYNIEEGTVGYNLSYDNRPENCATGVISETISITKNNPTDVHAVITVLGRASGPILQSIGTQTAYTQELNIEAVVPPLRVCVTGEAAGDEPEIFFSGAPVPQYELLVQQLYNNITGADNTVFTTNDSESFDVKTGRYSRQVAWIYTKCEPLS